MKIAVIHYRGSPTTSAQELLNEIERLGHTPLYLKIHELDAYIEENHVFVVRFRDKIDIDGGVIRSIGLTITLDTFMKRIGVLDALASYSTLINQPDTIMYVRDKWRSLLRLALNNIPVPNTLLTENPYAAKRYCERKNILVYKPLMGSLGLGSTLVNDPELAYHITRSLLNIGLPSYYQVFLDKPGYDFRVFVVGDQVVSAMKRVGGSGWKTNIAQGARGVKIEEKDYPEVFELAIKTASILKLDYAGIDIAYDMGSEKYYVLEANAFPQWQGLRKATGENIAYHIINYLIEKIKK
ncbi:MAG: RimK family alpha-L-glutamate ligase [Desulfurococcales archaeon ex4484_58]|nr:MAG: RimK family alpha-L-glutamate ligase [Desulfurococcales archaeon ex4484_58]